MNSRNGLPEKGPRLSERKLTAGKKPLSASQVTRLNIATNRQLLQETGLLVLPPWWESADPLTLVWGQLNSAAWMIKDTAFYKYASRLLGRKIDPKETFPSLKLEIQQKFSPERLDSIQILKQE